MDGNGFSEALAEAYTGIEMGKEPDRDKVVGYGVCMGKATL